MLKSIFTFALFSTALAAPLEKAKRDIATIQTELGNVNTALVSLDTAVKSLTGPAQAGAILTASNMVNTVIMTATKNIMGTTAISLTDALQLQNTGSTLSTQAMTTVMDLIGKKAIINQIGAGPTTLMALTMQKTNSNALAMAVTSKVPGVAQSIASQQTAMIGTALDMGITAFSATNNTKRSY